MNMNKYIANKYITIEWINIIFYLLSNIYVII